MGRSLGLFTVVVCLMCTMLLANSSSAAPGGNCQTRLVNTAYDCLIDSTLAPEQTACFEFATGGLSANFDLFISSMSSSDDLGCTCDTTGSFTSHSFNGSSSSFECVDKGASQLNGKLKSDKISGQATDAAGASLIYTCTKRSSPCP